MIVTEAPTGPTEASQDGRDLRYGRRWHARRHTTHKRIAGCGRWPTGGDRAGVMLKRTADGTCFLSGVQSCGSVWLCAVCQAKIGQRRAVELSDGITRWLAAGNSAHFVTFTVPHRRSVALVPVLGLIGALPFTVPLSFTFDAVASSWRSSLTGRAWRSYRRAFGILGYVRTLEATWGQANGWHPHIHAVFFIDGRLTDERRAALYEVLWSRWHDAVWRTIGYRPDRAAFHAEEVANGEGLGRYMVKLGLELHRHDLKQGKRPDRLTPWQILDAASDGHPAAVRLWQEWERVTFGRRCMTWGVGTRALLGLGADKTDEEVAAEELDGEDVLLIDFAMWHHITKRPCADSRLLRHAETGGITHVLLWLRALRQLH